MCLISGPTTPGKKKDTRLEGFEREVENYEIVVSGLRVPGRVQCTGEARYKQSKEETLIGHDEKDQVKEDKIDKDE